MRGSSVTEEVQDAGDISVRTPNQFLFTGDCIFQGGVGMFFEGCAGGMAVIFDELFDKRFPVKQVHDRVALFYGHDYGWKNLTWAADFLAVHDTIENKHNDVHNRL